MSKTLKLICVLGFLFFATNLWGQATLQGHVSDIKNHHALAGANVSIKELDLGTATDSHGYFLFEHLKAGKYTLVVNYIGYKEVRKDFELSAGEQKELNIQLDINIQELLAVEIRDDKLDNHPYAKITIKKARLDETPVRDIGDFMRSIPNVSAVRKGGANLDPVIRSFKFDQLNVQLDNGISMEGGCPNRMDPTTAHVEAEDIEAIEVLKGPYALRYGPVMGGVVNMLTINPRPFNTFQLHVKGNFGVESNWSGMRQHLSVLGGGQTVFFALTGNNSDYGNYRDGNGNTVKSSFRKMGYTAKVGFAPAKNHIITLSYSEFYARDVAFPALSMDERSDNTKIYALDYKANRLSKTINTLEFKAYKSSVDHTMDNVQRSFSDTVVGIAHNLADKEGMRAEAGLNLGSGHLFTGFDFYQIHKDGARNKHMIGQDPKPDGSIPLKKESLWNKAYIANAGLFTEYKNNFNQWEMVGALRLDVNKAHSDSISLLNMMGVDLIGTPADSTFSTFTNISFSLGATYNITEQLSLGASLGRGVRSPGMIERFIILLPVGYDNYEYLGNPLLKPESNNEADLILKYHSPSWGALELTAFYSLIGNYIGGVYIPKTQQKPLTAQVLGVKKFDNLGTASIRGFELGYASPQHYLWQLHLTAAYTAGSIKEVEVFTFDNNGNATSSAILKNDPLAEIPPLDVKAQLSYSLLNKKLIPAISLRWVAAQNRVSKANLEPTSPSFTLVNLNLLYRYNEAFSIAAGVNNLFDLAYTEHLNRRVLGTDYRLAEPGRIAFVNLIFNL